MAKVLFHIYRFQKSKIHPITNYLSKPKMTQGYVVVDQAGQLFFYEKIFNDYTILLGVIHKPRVQKFGYF